MMRPGSIPMDLFCMKSDYSDSSMTLNTGVAKLYNDVMLELGLLTPPQRYQLEQAGGDLNAVKVRQSIDGFPHRRVQRGDLRRGEHLLRAVQLQQREEQERPAVRHGGA